MDSISERNLKGVHPDLVKVVRRAYGQFPFRVTEGLRSLARQKALLAANATTTMKSRHLTGHAVDLVPMVDGKPHYDWPLFYKLAPVMKQAAKELGVEIEWGGDWRTFKDGPHFQLPWGAYP